MASTAKKATRAARPERKEVNYVETSYTSETTDFGEVMTARYTIGNKIVMQREITFRQQEQITSMLVGANVDDLVSFNDIAGKYNWETFHAALVKGGLVRPFLSLVLTTEGGGSLPDTFFDTWPGEIMSGFVEDVIRDFFVMSPHVLSGLRRASETRMGLELGRQQIGNMLTQQSTEMLRASLQSSALQGD